MATPNMLDAVLVSDLGDAVQAAIDRNKPVLIDANIAADTDPMPDPIGERLFEE